MKVYDCFTYYNELPLLEVRLKLLNQFVDYFVIVECDHTQRGNYKGFNLPIESEAISKYRDKIRYIKVEDAPQVKGNGQWEIEHYQRNCILRGLYDCKEEDLVMISDLDEIPAPEIFKNIHERAINKLGSGKQWLYNMKEIYKRIRIGKKMWRNQSLLEALDYTPVSLYMRMFYYYMNCEAKSGWHGTVMTKFKNLVVPQTLRMRRNNFPSIDGGWHFSYLGGVAKVRSKLDAIVDDTPAIMEIMEKFSSNDEYIEACIAEGKDIYGRVGRKYEYEFINLEDIGLPNIAQIMAVHPEFFRDEKK